MHLSKRICAQGEIKYFDGKKSLLMQKLCCSLAVTHGNSDCHDVGREEKIIVPFYFRVLGFAISFQAI